MNTNTSPSHTVQSNAGQVDTHHDVNRYFLLEEQRMQAVSIPPSTSSATSYTEDGPDGDEQGADEGATLRLLEEENSDEVLNAWLDASTKPLGTDLRHSGGFPRLHSTHE